MNSKIKELITVSTVTPVYAGEDYLVDLVNKLSQLRALWVDQGAPTRLVESIFVDDGSVDGSFQVLTKLAQEYDWLNVISLSRNYGQHSATVAGICHSSTDWVVTLDEDLQHEPDLINELFKHQVEKKLDVVYARPKHAVHGNSWRDKSSRIVKKILAKLTSTPQIRLFNSFRLIRGSIARAAASSSSSSTYFDISISWFTKSCDAIEIDLHDNRFVDQNKSGYGFFKLVKHARRLLVSADLDIASTGLVIGFGSVLFAILIGVFSVAQKLFFPASIDSVGWTSLITVVTFFSGVMIALLCLALEYLHILVLNTLGRPTFFTIDRSADHLLKTWFK